MPKPGFIAIKQRMEWTPVHVDGDMCKWRSTLRSFLLACGEKVGNVGQRGDTCNQKLED